MLPWRRCSRCPTCLCRWQRDRRDALTWRGGERSPCRQGATRAAQGPDPGLYSPSPQLRPYVTDFADPLPTPPGPGLVTLIREASTTTPHQANAPEPSRVPALGPLLEPSFTARC